MRLRLFVAHSYHISSDDMYGNLLYLPTTPFGRLCIFLVPVIYGSFFLGGEGGGGRRGLLSTLLMDKRQISRRKSSLLLQFICSQGDSLMRTSKERLEFGASI